MLMGVLLCAIDFQTNDALVASLLRLKDNKVHVEEAERSLRKREKYSELIILYEKKGLHKKGTWLLIRTTFKWLYENLVVMLTCVI